MRSTFAPSCALRTRRRAHTVDVRRYQLFRGFPRVVAKIKSVLIDEVRAPSRPRSAHPDRQLTLSPPLAVPGHEQRPVRARQAHRRLVGLAHGRRRPGPVECVVLAALPARRAEPLADACPSFFPSVYGWRNAEIENLEKMLKGASSRRCRSGHALRSPTLTLPLHAEFEPVKQIFLEENYRSTGAILGAALAVVRQGASPLAASTPLFPPHAHPRLHACRHQAHQQVAHDLAPLGLVGRAAPGAVGPGRGDLHRVDDQARRRAPRRPRRLQRLRHPPAVRRPVAQHRGRAAESRRPESDGRRAQVLRAHRVRPSFTPCPLSRPPQSLDPS